MPKTRIVLASVLKPITDIRMFGKLALSLVRHGGFEVHLIGQPATHKNLTDVYFHPLPRFTRLSAKRLQAQKEYYQILHQVKPEAIIVTTPELLPVSLSYSILFKAELFYDVQENYFRNITEQPTWPAWLKPFLAYPLRLFEKASATRISHFFLAEKSYADELTFLGKNYTVLENKYLPSGPEPIHKTFPVTPDLTKPVTLLYSGTIAEVYGIFEAVALTEKLYQLNPNIRLHIIGFCAQNHTLLQLKAQIRDKPYITVTGGDQLVPHAAIVKAIRNAQVGLLPYQPNPSTARCMPTKLFEYLANALPMLLPENPLWTEPVRKSRAGFTIDFQNPDPEVILEKLGNETFYTKGIPPDVFWQEEEKKLLAIFDRKAPNN